MGPLVRSLYQEFKESRGLCNSGFCPECELIGKMIEMFVNQGDIFECPECHLIISLATSGRATILRRRGTGKFKAREPYHGASGHIQNLNLSRESLEHSYESDGTFIKDRDELATYLAEIAGFDPHV
jgi:hypothetical protein